MILTAFVLAATLAGAWDLFWRRCGFVPSVIDDVNIWSIWRRRADAGPDVLALAGSSRLLMGLDLKTLREHFPSKHIVQLSINGGSALSVLQDLADDEHFCGSVICEILPHHAYADPPWVEAWGGYRTLPWSQQFEAPMRVYLSEKTNLFLPDLALIPALKEFAKHRQFPKPSFVHFNKERQGQLDYSQVDPSALVAMRTQTGADYAVIGKPLVGADFERRIAAIRQLAQKISRRGGRVLFFRMVSSSPIREIQSTRFPDPLYWDIFCRRVGFPCLNYTDVPGLADFTCPEGVHLDQSEQAAFTAILANAVVNRGLLQ